MKRGSLIGISALVLGTAAFTGCSKSDDTGVTVLRIANWEEYIDLGGWDEEEVIDLDEDTEIFGENSMVEDFENWYYETYGKRVKVEYSTFGTNEELYNQMTIGDVFDLACPSEYMIMKLMREDKVLKYTESFFDTEDENNYYALGVSPFIKKRFDGLNIEGKELSEYAAGYMWGTLGIVYNPEYVTDEQASCFDIMLDKSLKKQITIKDSVRDSYFAAAAIHFKDILKSEDLLNSENYYEQLTKYFNKTDEDTVDAIEDILSDIKDNVYSFETDSGKADMVTGKVLANLQWSGDAVYTLDQADEDGVELCYAVPEEGSNLWFDGWVLLKDGIGEDTEKLQAAQAFVNFVSMPENAIRNMYYIGYTSAISGGDSDLIFNYLDWNYGAEEEEDEENGEDAEGAEDAEEAEDADEAENAETGDETEVTDEDEETVEYCIGYFFSDAEDADEEYCITTEKSQTRRQLYAQYPPIDVVERCAIMECFSDEDNARINHMWINVRCFDPSKIFGG